MDTVEFPLRPQTGSKSTKWALAREQCGGTVYLKLEDTIYIQSSPNPGRHVTGFWLRTRRSARPLKPASSTCSLFAFPCSLCARSYSPYVLPCSPSATSYFRSCRPFLASLSETLCTAGSGCWSDGSIYGSTGCSRLSLSSFSFVRPFVRFVYSACNICRSIDWEGQWSWYQFYL